MGTCVMQVYVEYYKKGARKEESINYREHVVRIGDSVRNGFEIYQNGGAVGNQSIEELVSNIFN